MYTLYVLNESCQLDLIRHRNEWFSNADKNTKFCVHFFSDNDAEVKLVPAGQLVSKSLKTASNET